MALADMDEVALGDRAIDIPAIAKAEAEATPKGGFEALSGDADEKDDHRRWTREFEGVELCVDDTTEVAYALMDTHSVDADLGFVDTLVGIQAWSGWSHALVPKSSELKLYL